MRKIPFIFLLLIICSCGAVKKKTTYGKKRKVTVAASSETVAQKDTKTDTGTRSLSKADDIINTALTFSGTRYKYGGTTKRGMDCSGLLYVAFGEHNVALPRISYQMAEKGKRVKTGKVTKGDLLFFKTGKTKKDINHVGLVVSTTNNEIKFIHSSSSRGVIVSSLREGYWNYAFVKAMRVL